MKKINLKSQCCKANIKYSDISPDFIGDKNNKIGTCYCICSKCGEPCNILSNERKIWTINPKTKIIKDKRLKIKTKQIIKEIGVM